MGIALALVAFALAGAAPAPTCSFQGGRTWRELETAQLVLVTDLAPDDADALAEQLEVMLGAVLRGLFDVPPALPRSLRVVALASVDDFRRLAPAPIDGYFARREGGGTVVLRGDVGRVTRGEIVAHELTHAVVAEALPRRPAWLDEGLATYMEGIGEAGDGELLAVGRPPPRRLAAARRDRAPVGEVLARRGPGLAPDQYATSWLLVHYLLAQHRDRFVAYETRLARGQDPEAAWRAEFPEWDPASAASVAALDRALVRYVRDDGRYVETRFLAHGEGARRVSAMSAAEVAEMCRGLPRWRGNPQRRPRPTPSHASASGDSPAPARSVAEAWAATSRSSTGGSASRPRTARPRGTGGRGPEGSPSSGRKGSGCRGSRSGASPTS